MTGPVTIVGGGLAGCEAAWQLARRGIPSRLFEMRPLRETEAHETDRLAELVCSNSFRSEAIESAVGLLKEEMRRLGSLVMEAADQARVPAGAALAVDRERFADAITCRIEGSPAIEVVRREVTDVPSGPTIVATGPLTSQPLYERLEALFGRHHLYFYDAISPIVTSDSIDFDKAFRASRYGRGGDDYVNCPLDRESYERFVEEILAARKVPTRDFEQCVVFEGCMPIEELARRGRDTLAFGPMRPVGLTDPRTGRRPHAVVQLRQDNQEGTLYSMVGFQTKMAWPEQRRVFRMVPGLERAAFVRLGSLHRNTFFQSPAILRPTLQFRGREDLYFAGQIIGVEGYVESAGAGLLAGVNVARGVAGLAPVVPPRTTSLGAVLAYVTEPSRRDFQPMNTNYGLFPPLPGRLKGREKKRAQAMRAREELTRWMEEYDLAGPEERASQLEPVSA